MSPAQSPSRHYTREFASRAAACGAEGKDYSHIDYACDIVKIPVDD